MKFFLFLLFAGICGQASAQTNAPASPKTPVQLTDISSDSARFDNNDPKRMEYDGHVVFNNPKVKLTCGRLVVNLPANDSHPTNIVAETKVVIDFIDQKGQTNHLTSDKAVYAYSVVNSVTNETVTFTGPPIPKVETPDLIILSEPMVWDRMANQFHFTNEKMIPRRNFDTGNGTNASPLKLF